MQCNIVRYITVLVGLSLATPALAAKLSSNSPDATPPSFWADRQQGYYWYEDPVAPTEEEPEEPAAATAPAAPPTAHAYSDSQLWSMPTAQFRGVLKATEELAITTLAEPDVYEYKRIQDVARRKSAAFASVDAVVVAKNPRFDLRDAQPVSARGRDANTRAASRDVQGLLLASQGEYGLLYFTRANCDACEQEDKILAQLRQRYGYDLLRVDIEQQPLVAEQFGVDRAPALVLIARANPSSSISVSRGVAALDQIELGIYRGIRLLEGGDPAQWGIFDYQRGGGLDPLAGRDK